MTTLQQPKFVQITGDNNYGLIALDEEGNVWEYVKYYGHPSTSAGISPIDKERTGWYLKEGQRHATTS